MNSTVNRGERLLKLAGKNPFKWLKRSKAAAGGATDVVKPKKKKRVGFKVKALGAGATFGAGAYTDHAIKLRGRAQNPYQTYNR